MEAYGESRAVRPFILAVTAAVPILGGVVQGADVAIIARLEHEKTERLETLITELESGLEDFGGAIPIQRSNQVIHAAYATIEATLRTSRREKIRAFGKLLVSGITPNPKISLENEHEDYLKILDELSVRELSILSLLSSYEIRHPRDESENDVQWTERFWGEFEQSAVDELNIPLNELSGLLMRLVRTGTFEPFMGAYLDYTGGRGKLTGAYKRLESILRETPSTFDTGQIT